MKARIMFLMLGLLVAVGALFSATQASAIKEVDRLAFGMFGITQGQTARLNVTNLDTRALLPAVQIDLSFIDSEGNTLLQKVHTLQPGQSAALDLSGNQFARGGRTQVRALVQFVGSPDTRDDPFFLPSLEVIDNATGRTAFIVPEGIRAQKVCPAN